MPTGSQGAIHVKTTLPGLQCVYNFMVKNRLVRLRTDTSHTIKLAGREI